MKKPETLYIMKYLTTESPYFQIYRGNFRQEESALAKAEEMKKDPTMLQIIIKKRITSEPVAKSYYKWNQGFETVHLGR